MFTRLIARLMKRSASKNDSNEEERNDETARDSTGAIHLDVSRCIACGEDIKTIETVHLVGDGTAMCKTCAQKTSYHRQHHL